MFTSRMHTSRTHIHARAQPWFMNNVTWAMNMWFTKPTSETDSSPV